MSVPSLSVIIPWADRPEIGRCIDENAIWIERSRAEAVVVVCGGSSEHLREILLPNAPQIAGPGPIFVLPGNGDGTFQAPFPVTDLDTAIAVTFGDFNGDGRLDMAAPVSIDDIGLYDIRVALGVK